MNGPDERARGRADLAPPAVDPAARDELFDMLNGYWRTQMVCAAAESGPVSITPGTAITTAERDELRRLFDLAELDVKPVDSLTVHD